MHRGYRRNACLRQALEQLESRRLLSEATGVLRTIEGVTFEQEGTLNGSPGFGTIPPSPQVTAGPDHLVSLTNSAIEFHTKTGTRTFQQNLFGFFQNQAFTEMFDAHAIYDPAAQRFIIVALDWTSTAAGSPFGNTSRIFFAVSDDADPNGDWAYSQIDSRLTIGGQPRWADHLGAALGNGALFLTADMYSFTAPPAYVASRLWIVDYEQLLAGTTSATVHDPFAATGLTAHEGGFMPTHIRSSISGNVGTYLLNTNAYTQGASDLFALVAVTNPLGTPAFINQFVSMGGNVDNQITPLPGAPQQGTSVTLLPNDRRFQTAATWINGTLYAANTVVPVGGADTGDSTVRWYQVTIDGPGGATLAASGNIGAENLGADTHTFYPSITADGDGNWAITFSASSATMFPSAAFTTGVGTTVEPAAIFAAGEDFYVRTYLTPSSVSANNRWGDWSGIAHDPADGTFWAFNLYAGPRGGLFQDEDGRWRTRMANFAATDAPPRMGAPDLIAASDLGAASDDNLTSDNTPTFRGATLPGATVTLFADNVQVGQATAAADGTWSITASELADGVRAITASASNASGAGPVSPALNVTIDTAAPTLDNAVFIFESSHSIDFTFSESVADSVEAADFIVNNLTTSQLVPAAGQAIAINPQGTIVTLTFPGAAGPPAGILADGNYTAAIAAAGITDAAGNAVAAPPFAFFVFAGDANRDRIIDIGDFAILGARFNQPGTFSQADFNYDGIADISDFAILASKFNTPLPAPADAPRGAMNAPFASVLEPDDDKPRRVSIVAELLS